MMKRTAVFVFAMVILAVVVYSPLNNRIAASSDVEQIQAAGQQKSGPTVKTSDMMPTAFTKNQGQWDEKVKFRANAGGATMWFTEDGVYYQFTRRIAENDSTPDDPMNMPHEKFDHEPDSIEQLVIEASFVGANPNPEITGDNMMEYKCNYFIGNDPYKWHTDVPNYGSVTLRNIYEGVDLQFFGTAGGKLMYRYSIALGSDLDQITLAYDGLGETSFDEAGRLVAQTGWGEISGLLAAPSAKAGLISTEFSLSSANTLLSDVERSSYAQRSPQAVELVYSTYLGGGDWDWGFGIAVDDNGNAYVTGETNSDDFPTENPYQATYQGGNFDVFVAKLSSSGSTLIYSTYLGGGGVERGNDIVVDGDGNVYITGYTDSPDFPTTPGAYDISYNGFKDAFVTKLFSSGDSLIYSTYLGGGSDDGGIGIAVDGSGNAYVTGLTWSINFPTLNPYQGTYQGSCDVFVTKLSSTGSSLVYGTYLGGGSDDRGNGIAIDGIGNAYVTGETESIDFPTLNPYQMHQGGADVFVTKLSSSGNSLIYSTYFGGGTWETSFGIAVDGSGNAYVTGYTGSDDFPTEDPYQGSFQGEADVFVTRLSSSGSSLIYSTYLGGGGWDFGFGIAIDGSGNAYVTGQTSSSDFPTKDPNKTDHGNWDAFVTKLNSSGSSLIYSTYLGGGGGDEGRSITLDGSDNAYVTGLTYSYDFPTENPYQTDLQGIKDAFVTKLSDGYPAVPHISVNPENLSFTATQYGTLPPSQNFTITNIGGGMLDWTISDDTDWLDESPISGSSNSEVINVSINATDLWPDTYNATITVSSPNADNSPQTVSVSYEVQPSGTADVSGIVQDGCSGSGLGDVLVELIQGEIVRYTTTTEASTGYYGFSGILAGIYTARYSKSGYETESYEKTIEPGWNLLSTVNLIAAGYVSSEPLVSALDDFCQEYTEYMQHMSDRIVDLESELFNELYKPEYYPAKAFTENIWNRFQLPTADILAAVALDAQNFAEAGHYLSMGLDSPPSEHATFQSLAKNITFILFEKWAANAYSEIYGYLTDLVIPGAELKDTPMIIIQEDQPIPGQSVYSTTEVLGFLIDWNKSSDIPACLPSDFPVSSLVEDLNRCKKEIEDITYAEPTEFPKAYFEDSWIMAGYHNLDYHSSYSFGLINYRIREVQKRLLELGTGNIFSRKFHMGCQLFGTVGTSYKVTNILLTEWKMKLPKVLGKSLFWGGVACNSIAYAASAYTVDKQADLAETITEFNLFWPDYFSRSFNFYRQVNSLILNAALDPMSFSASKDFDNPTLDIPSALCFGVSEMSKHVDGTVTLDNTDAAKTGKMMIMGAVYFPMGGSHETVSQFRSDIIDVPPSSTGSIAFSFDLPTPTSFNLYRDVFVDVDFLTTLGRINLRRQIRVGVLPDCPGQAPYLNLLNLAAQKIGEGQTYSVEFSSSSDVQSTLFSMTYGGSDVDLHLYDQSGNHVGRNYETGEIELQIPGSEYFDDSLRSEWIRIPGPSGTNYQVEAVGICLPDSEVVVIDALEEITTAPELVSQPYDLFLGLARGDTVVYQGMLFDRSGQNQIEIDTAELSDFSDTSGHFLPAGALEVTYPGIIQADSNAYYWLTVSSLDDQPVGVYSGSLVFRTDTDSLKLPVQIDVRNRFVCGDTDGSQAVDIDDVVFLINYIFAGGPAPDPLAKGDANCSGNVDIDDVVFLINYIFAGGPAPCDIDGDGYPDC